MFNGGTAPRRGASTVLSLVALLCSVGFLVALLLGSSPHTKFAERDSTIIVPR